jgi:hypothetical protein
VKNTTIANRREVATFLSEGLTQAQRRALTELAGGEFARTHEGWKTQNGRFVPLIVVAKLRKRGLAILDADKRVARMTFAALPVVELLSAGN